MDVTWISDRVCMAWIGDAVIMGWKLCRRNRDRCRAPCRSNTRPALTEFPGEVRQIERGLAVAYTPRRADGIEQCDVHIPRDLRTITDDPSSRRSFPGIICNSPGWNDTATLCSAASIPKCLKQLQPNLLNKASGTYERLRDVREAVHQLSSAPIKAIGIT